MATERNSVEAENTVVESPPALVFARFGAIPEDAQINQEKRCGTLAASSRLRPRNVRSVLGFNVIRYPGKRLSFPRSCFYTGFSKSPLTGRVMTPRVGELRSGKQLIRLDRFYLRGAQSWEMAEHVNSV